MPGADAAEPARRERSRRRRRVGACAHPASLRRAVGQQDRPRRRAGDGREHGEASARARRARRAAARRRARARPGPPPAPGCRARRALLPPLTGREARLASAFGRRRSGRSGRRRSRARRGCRCTRSSPMPTSRVQQQPRGRRLGVGRVLESTSTPPWSRPNSCDVAHADVGVGGHAHVVGHDHARLAHAHVDVERHVARRAGRCRAGRPPARPCRARSGRAGRRRRPGPVLALADAAVEVDARPRPRCRPPGASATAGSTSQRTGFRKAPATIARAARTITSAAPASRAPPRRRTRPASATSRRG